MASFEDSYTETFNMLNRARDLHNPSRRNQQLNLRDIAPGSFQKSFFASKLRPDVASFVTLMYDASQPGATLSMAILWPSATHPNLQSHSVKSRRPRSIFAISSKLRPWLHRSLTMTSLSSSTHVVLLDTELLHHLHQLPQT